MPIANTVAPSNGYHRYLPVRVTSLPTMVVEMTMPTEVGSTVSPARVADAPFTSCWNSGRKMAIPKFAAPMQKVVPTHTRMMRLPARCNGNNGSTARRSCHTNNHENDAPTTAQPMRNGDVHE